MTSGKLGLMFRLFFLYSVFIFGGCDYGDIADVAMEKAGISSKTSESGIFVAVGVRRDSLFQ